MKVGILSMQRIYNYGSWLQAYALKKIIAQITICDVEFVDYRIGKTIDSKGIQKIGYYCKLLENGLIEFVTNSKCITHILHFNELDQIYAYKHLYQPLLLGKNSNEKNYTPTLDVLVIGSDEVFNCLQNNVRVGYSPELFGFRSKARNKITYAASFGNTTYEKLLANNLKEEIANYISEFDRLSVRDKNSFKIIYKLTGIEPEIHLDPVLMYDFSVEDNKIEIPEEKYMIVYAYRNRLSKEEIDAILSYAQMHGLKIYSIGGKYAFADRYIYDSPLNILQYFKYATCVVTDTFHGTIFSVIHKRSFATFIRKSENVGYGNEEKLSDLLVRLNLKDREVRDTQILKLILDKDIDYEQVDRILQLERKKCRNYLLEGIR